MTWGTTLKTFGVCGNFRFAIHDLTDIKATRSLLKPMNMDRVYYVSSTNTTDNADVLAGQTLAWTGTADNNVLNEIKDTSEVFDAEIDGAQAHNTADNLTSFVTYKDADELYCHKKTIYSTDPSSGQDAVYDLCPDGNETYTIYSERIVQFIAATADDDGTVLVMGA